MKIDVPHSSLAPLFKEGYTPSCCSDWFAS